MPLFNITRDSSLFILEPHALLTAKLSPSHSDCHNILKVDQLQGSFSEAATQQTSSLQPYLCKAIKTSRLSILDLAPCYTEQTFATLQQHTLMHLSQIPQRSQYFDIFLHTNESRATIQLITGYKTPVLILKLFCPSKYQLS